VPEISVVIVTKYDRDQIDALSLLNEQSFQDFELLIQNEKGISKARNEGIRRSSADKIVFLDDDSLPREDYLKNANLSLENHSIVAGRIVAPQDGLLGELPRHYDHGSEGHYVQGATGCNMAYRREVFDTIGGFDENISWGHEETDLVERAKNMGYRIWYEPGMTVEHKFADSITDYWRKCWDLGTAKVYFNRKHNVDLERRVREGIPITLSSTSLEEFVVRSVGKGIRGVAKIYEMACNEVPNHEAPREDL
jgi:GT2 family glycosyltransferase